MFIAFRLKPGRDDDLIKWAESLGAGDKSYYIREAIRQGLFRITYAPICPSVRIEAKQVGESQTEVNEADLDAALDAWS
jgi:predicted DNA-binding protein